MVLIRLERLVVCGSMTGAVHGAETSQTFLLTSLLLHLSHFSQAGLLYFVKSSLYTAYLYSYLIQSA